MNPQDAIVPFTAVLMLGLIWIRTRVQYSRAGTGPLKLQRAGRIYFGAVLALLAVGWFVAPVLGRTFWPVPGVTPTLMRVVWCLATYYVFIAVHRVMKTRGTAVFLPQADPRPSGSYPSTTPPTSPTTPNSQSSTSPTMPGSPTSSTADNSNTPSSPRSSSSSPPGPPRQ